MTPSTEISITLPLPEDGRFFRCLCYPARLLCMICLLRICCMLSFLLHFTITRITSFNTIYSVSAGIIACSGRRSVFLLSGGQYRVIALIGPLSRWARIGASQPAPSAEFPSRTLTLHWTPIGSAGCGSRNIGRCARCRNKSDGQGGVRELSRNARNVGRCARCRNKSDGQGGVSAVDPECLEYRQMWEMSE